ncbi:histidine kinase N-terminal 7TM domain-containing protein [Pseudomonas sp. TMP25]|uniref:histidine kinase N-terminal 7TM domain-containing protein n=1 Tax=Pseudomonas sp. TMP25 TaxID=3136561 RepID=UPI003100EEC4
MNVCGNSAWALSAPLLITGAACIGVLLLARWVMRQRYFPGRESFILLHLASVWWMVAASLEMAAQGAPCKVFWAGMAWPGILLTPTFWAIFLWQYVNSVRQPLSRPSTLGLTVVPLLVWLVALSNPWHGLFYGTGTAPLSDEPGAPIGYQHGPLFFAAAAYVYLFMSFCLAVLLRAVIVSYGLYRRYYLAFVIVTAVPWVANISYVVFGWMLFGFDPTPFSFVFTLVAFAWLIVKVRLFDLMPVARHLLLDALRDPVLVVDAQWRVIEASPVALKLAGLRNGWQGRQLADWPILGADLQKLLSEPLQGEHGRLLAMANSARYFEVRIRAIERVTHRGTLVLGHMLYLHDVTQRHLSELKLAEALALSEERWRSNPA